jgi:hypothetical protein
MTENNQNPHTQLKQQPNRKLAKGDQAEIKFDKAQGSAHNDVADIKDVAREAAKKSR